MADAFDDVAAIPYCRNKWMEDTIWFNLVKRKEFGEVKESNRKDLEDFMKAIRCTLPNFRKAVNNRYDLSYKAFQGEHAGVLKHEANVLKPKRRLAHYYYALNKNETLKKPARPNEFLTTVSEILPNDRVFLRRLSLEEEPEEEHDREGGEEEGQHIQPPDPLRYFGK